MEREPKSARRYDIGFKPGALTALVRAAVLTALFALAPLRCAEPASTYANPDLAMVRYEQRIGAVLPVEEIVRDSDRGALPLGSYFQNRPVVLVFGYARCPQLCSVIAAGVIDTLRRIEPTAGRDYDVLYLSIDPTDTPRDLAAMKRRDVRRYGRNAAELGWHYASATAATIERLATAAGFHFTYDPRTKLYAHPSGFVVVTPSGQISRYVLGLDFDPKDVAAAIERAASGGTGASVFDLLLVCVRGAAVGGRYGKIIWLTLAAAVALTVVFLGWGIARMLAAERRAMVTGIEVAAVAPTASLTSDDGRDDRRYLQSPGDQP